MDIEHGLEQALTRAGISREELFATAIHRVRRLHFRGEMGGLCIECSRLIPGPGVRYPCPTIRALDDKEE